MSNVCDLEQEGIVRLEGISGSVTEHLLDSPSENFKLLRRPSILKYEEFSDCRLDGSVGVVRAKPLHDESAVRRRNVGTQRLT